MVLGHSRCGAIDAAIKVVRDGASLPGHLQEMVREIRPAVKAAKAGKPDDVLAAAVAENIRRGVWCLETAKPILADCVRSGKVKVVGAHYELANGKIALVRRGRTGKRASALPPGRRSTERRAVLLFRDDDAPTCAERQPWMGSGPGAELLGMKASCNCAAASRRYESSCQRPTS